MDKPTPKELRELFVEQYLEKELVEKALQVFGDGELGRVVVDLLEGAFLAGGTCALKRLEKRTEESCQKT